MQYHWHLTPQSYVSGIQVFLEKKKIWKRLFLRMCQYTVTKSPKRTLLRLKHTIKIYLKKKLFQDINGIEWQKKRQNTFTIKYYFPCRKYMVKKHF